MCIRDSLIGGPGGLPIHQDPLGVAGFVGHGTPLDNPGNLEIFVQTHKKTFLHKKAGTWRAGSMADFILLNGVLQGFAGLENRGLGSGDGDGLLCPGVDAGTGEMCIRDSL